MKNYFQHRPRGRVSRISHARGYNDFTNQMTLQQNKYKHRINGQYSFRCLKWERTQVRSIKPSSEVGLSRADRQGKCQLIIRFSKFLEIQTAVKFENVKSTKILFLFMFYYDFQFVLIQIAKFRQVPHFLKLPSKLSYFRVLMEDR